MLRSRLDIFGEGRHGVKELFDPSVDQPSRERLKRGLPFPVCESRSSIRIFSHPRIALADIAPCCCRVDSCWDGMIAMNAEPFRTIDTNPHFEDRTGPSGVSPSTLRASFKPTTFRTALNAAGECGKLLRIRTLGCLIASSSSSVSSSCTCSRFRVQDDCERFLESRIQPLDRKFKRLSRASR